LRRPIYRSLATISVVVVLLATVFSLLKIQNRPFSAAGDFKLADNLDTLVPARRAIFPYSVIPGGVESADELQKVLAGDPVARRHYAGFEVSRAVLMRTREDRLAYVSYRANGNVYWTSYRVRIPMRELLLTDGANTVRTRCGNRISELPMKPILKGEPIEEALLYLPPQLFDQLIRFPTEMEPPADSRLETTIVGLPSLSLLVLPPEERLAPSVGPAGFRLPRRAGAVPASSTVPEPMTILTVAGAGLILAMWRALVRPRKRPVESENV
jgi:hypothetical protein